MVNPAIALDSTVRSHDSNNSTNSKVSSAMDSKPESCLESKHSLDILLSEKQQRHQEHQPHSQQHIDERQKLRNLESKNDSNLLMFTSCGQLLLDARSFNLIGPSVSE
ncbi:uncharacterized protein LOC128888107 [Hylaeus anthracinus]|uniref:uncharacterized protein LOC128888107 n=1 Tax=Hylaeus anthracinus TaxID=313031 RepID=UPI0023B9952B|nr:uncharacterized protein LOC128888107 [Hylaeus anthracinus]